MADPGTGLGRPGVVDVMAYAAATDESGWRPIELYTIRACRHVDADKDVFRLAKACPDPEGSPSMAYAMRNLCTHWSSISESSALGRSSSSAPL